MRRWWARLLAWYDRPSAEVGGHSPGRCSPDVRSVVADLPGGPAPAAPSELAAEVELRRQDPEFMGRLHRILDEDREILDLLAADGKDGDS